MDKLVSIRMPRPLVNELKELVHKNHYLDLSEELRSVIRQHAKKYLEPATNADELKQQLEQDIKQQDKRLQKQELLKQLKDLLEVDE